MINSNNSAVIVANGNFPNNSVPLSFIENASYIVCCDGAANDFIARGYIPDAIVGDCDSISEENAIRFADILHPNREQETNDLTKSVQFCVNNGKNNLIIVAATGKREDHSLGNISLLMEYIDIAKVKMVTDFGVFTPINSTSTFSSFTGEQVSIFSFGNESITTSGLKYPINNRVLTNWWQGTLNESLGESFTINTKGKVILFQVFPK